MNARIRELDEPHLDDIRDVNEMVDGIKRIRERAARKPWRDFRSASLDPDLDRASDADIIRWMRNNATTEHRPVGTCRMGTDAVAVTNGEGRVHGIENSRVIDGSIMPRVPTANIQAPIMMVAEKIVEGMVNRSGRLSARCKFANLDICYQAYYVFAVVKTWKNCVSRKFWEDQPSHSFRGLDQDSAIELLAALNVVKSL